MSCVLCSVSCVLRFGGCGDGVMVLFVVCEFDKCWRDVTDIGVSWLISYKSE